MSGNEMVKETLWSSDGKHEVATLRVPPWETPVELYLWGARYFIRRAVEGVAEPRYCEARGTHWIPDVDLQDGKGEGAK